MIEKVNRLTPASTLEKYWDGKIPVNVKHILGNIGIRFCKFDTAPLEEALQLSKNDAILGMAFSNGDELGIIYSTRIDKDVTNYVLAHELAHCCLHMKPSEKFHIELKLSRDLYSKTKNRTVLSRYLESYKEVQSDRFAADLLIPTKSLVSFLQEHPTANIDGIANHFHVSREMVRLKTENLRRNKVGDIK